MTLEKIAKVYLEKEEIEKIRQAYYILTELNDTLFKNDIPDNYGIDSTVSNLYNLIETNPEGIFIAEQKKLLTDRKECDIIKVQKREITSQDSEKKFEKTLDKPKRIWYNKTIEKRKSHLKVQKKIKKLKKKTRQTELNVI